MCSIGYLRQTNLKAPPPTNAHTHTQTSYVANNFRKKTTLGRWFAFAHKLRCVFFTQTRGIKNRLHPFLPRPKDNYSLQVHIHGTSAVSKRNSLINMLEACRKTPLSLKHPGDTPSSAKNVDQETLLGRSCTAATWRTRWARVGRLTRSLNTVPYKELCHPRRVCETWKTICS